MAPLVEKPQFLTYVELLSIVKFGIVIRTLPNCRDLTAY